MGKTFRRIAGLPDLSVRSTLGEYMDDMDTGHDQLYHTLAQFKIINYLFSRYRYLVKHYLLPRMRLMGYREIVILDLGAGGCDFALWITRFCRKQNIKIKVFCLDTDPRAVLFGQKVCHDHDNIIVSQGSVSDIESLGVPVDFIFANHVLHHVEARYIPNLLRRVYDLSQNGFLINDLRRSYFSYIGFTLFGLIFLRGGFSFSDGRQSIRKGFIPQDLRTIVNSIGLENEITVGTVAPGRVFLWCEKQDTGK